MNKTERFQKFEEYFNKLLMENPQLIGNAVERDLDDQEYNTELAQSVTEKHKPILQITIYNIILDVYKFTTQLKNQFRYLFIQQSRIICCEFYTEEINSKCEFSGVWQNKHTGHGFVRRIVFDVFLRYFNTVLSDKIQTNEGKFYWQKLVKEALDNNYKVFVISSNLKKPIERVEDMEQFYNSREFRFVIEK